MTHPANGPQCRARHSSRTAALFILALVLAASPVRAAPPTDAEKEAVVGRPVALAVQPETVRLAGPRATQQLLVTGRYADGSERDLTPFCDLSAEDAGVVPSNRAASCTPARTAARPSSSGRGGRRLASPSSPTAATGSPSASAGRSSPR